METLIRIENPEAIIEKAKIFILKKIWGGASLVVQWIRIRLPMQGTQV